MSREEITVHVRHRAEIGEFLYKYPCFNFLRNIDVPCDERHNWIINSAHWNYTDQAAYFAQILFIGKTGYGKSSTLNKLTDSAVFETSDVSACTKNLYSSIYRINPVIPTFLSLNDLPGVGESNSADKQYYGWYKRMMKRSDTVVYILRADQRDYAVDEEVFNSMFKTHTERKKVLIGINCADKINPISRMPGLSAEQRINLDRKVDEISRIFNFPKTDILYYSATEGINLDILVQKIANKLRENLR